MHVQAQVMASIYPFSHIKVVIKYYRAPPHGVRQLMGRREFYFDSLLEAIWFLQWPQLPLGWFPYEATEARYWLVLGTHSVLP